MSEENVHHRQCWWHVDVGIPDTRPDVVEQSNVKMTTYITMTGHLALVCITHAQAGLEHTGCSITTKQTRPEWQMQ